MISVIIACRNEAPNIEATLSSVLTQEPPATGFEIILVDGMSHDGTRRIVEELAMSHPNLRIITNPLRIVSTGLNAAIKASKGDLIVRMDAHTEYAPDYLRQCFEVHNCTGVENVGGPWVARGDTFISRAIAAAFQSRFAVGGAPGHDPSYEGVVDTVYLGCWKRDIFERFGYFDAELVRNQDDEHNLRIVRGGGKIWQSPRIRSWYRPRGSLIALFRQYMQYGYWKVRVIQKHRLPASWRHLVPGGFVCTLGLLLLLSAISFLFSAFIPAPWSVLSPLVLASVLAIYGACTLAASVITAGKTEWKLLPILPLVFPCYHLGYGWGFLRGVWGFAIRKSAPQQAFSRLTR